MRRVVMTGLGCICAIGNTADDVWQSAREGRSGLAEVVGVPSDKLLRKVVGQVKGYDPADHFTETERAIIDRFSLLALTATEEALADSGLDIDEDLGRRTAVILGSGVGGLTTLDESFLRLYGGGPQRVHPFTVPKMMMNAAASQVSMRHGIKGPAYCIASACSSSNHAIGTAFSMIRQGQVEAAITGGSEAVVTLGGLKAWEALRVMAPDTCRPFSVDRKGMILGEGAGIVVLESLERARARGARIYGEVAGFGMSSDAGDLVAPSVEGCADAITFALRDARLDPEDIDYVNAHGTATPANDGNETRAIRRAFGAHADRLAVSSTKSMHGHALGAAGALEAVITLRAMGDGVAPPTANFTEPDPECDLDYVPNAARDMTIRAAVSNSFAFGGLNAVLVFRRLK